MQPDITSTCRRAIDDQKATDVFRSALAAHLNQVRSSNRLFEKVSGDLQHASVREISEIVLTMSETVRQMKLDLAVMQNAWRAFDDAQVHSDLGKIIRQAEEELLAYLDSE